MLLDILEQNEYDYQNEDKLIHYIDIISVLSKKKYLAPKKQKMLKKLYQWKKYSCNKAQGKD